MECSCGGQIKSSKAERSKQSAVLEFQECQCCGRCHFDSLRVAGRIIATGAEAQQGFAALDAGQPCPPSAPEQTVTPEPSWYPVEEQPLRDQLIRVEYLTDGYYIGHAGFFGSVWDLIARWQPHDNREALLEATIPKYPPGLSAPYWLLPSAGRAARPPLPEIPKTPRHESSLPPVGANFSFAF